MQHQALIKEIEKEMIVQRLIVNRGNQRRTALDLKIPKSTLHDRIRAYNIDIEKLVFGEQPAKASESLSSHTPSEPTPESEPCSKLP